MRVLVAQIKSAVGKQITVSGWVHRIRQLGAISFVVLRDRSGMAQLVYEGKFEYLPESIIQVTGTVAENSKAIGGFEIHPTSTVLLSAARDALPLPINRSLESVGLETILDNRVLALRNPALRGLFTVQSAIMEHFAAFMRSQEFIEVKTSKLVGTGTEGGTGLFEVSYFGQQVYLAQSPQFYKQAMVATGMERVFEIGPVYRAEKHDTPRHLNEYVSMDIEMAFIEDEQPLMDIEVSILQAIFEGLNREHGEILHDWKVTLPNAKQMRAIPRVSYEEARQIVGEQSGRQVFDIDPEGEKVLCEWALRERDIAAMFIFGFPRRKRPFYTYPRDQATASFDLLFGGVEITTGGRRINDYDMLLESMAKFRLVPESLTDYLQIFRYGCPPHGGFAIGLERLTQKIFGLSNIREASLFPRDRRRIRP